MPTHPACPSQQAHRVFPAADRIPPASERSRHPRPPRPWRNPGPKTASLPSRWLRPFARHLHGAWGCGARPEHGAVGPGLGLGWPRPSAVRPGNRRRGTLRRPLHGAWGCCRIPETSGSHVADRGQRQGPPPAHAPRTPSPTPASAPRPRDTPSPSSSAIPCSPPARSNPSRLIWERHAPVLPPRRRPNAARPVSCCTARPVR